jgi:hypothetical protein
MPALTRRRSSDHPFQQCWLIYYGDVHAARSLSTPAIRTIPSLGNGSAASIPDLVPANAQVPSPRRLRSGMESVLVKPH